MADIDDLAHDRIDLRPPEPATRDGGGSAPPSLLSLAGAPTPALHPSPGLPPEVVLRPYAGPSDHPGMVEAGNAWRTATGLIEIVTVEGLTSQYASMATSDPYADCFIAERVGKTVGYARVEWFDTRDGERTYGTILIVAPDPDRRAIVDVLTDRAEARAIEIAAGQRTDRPRVLDGFAPGADTELNDVYAARGYAPIRRDYEMIRPGLEAIPEVPLPAGLAVRPVRPEHLRTIWEAECEAFRDHWGPHDESEARWEHFRDDPVNDFSLWRVAWDGDQVAGQVRSYIDAASNARTGRLTGWTEYISVRRPWRRRGLARSLLADSLRAVRDRGMTEAALGVDAGNENGALALYESLGFVVHRVETIYRRPLPGYAP